MMQMKSVSTLERDWEDVLDDSSEGFRQEVQAANMLRALANPHRLKILKLLDQAPHNVMDLCERLSLRQSLASQHLARLRLDGIVAAERQGHHVVYSLQNARAREILAVLDGKATKPVKSKPRKKHMNGDPTPGTRRAAP
jgi:DNA-binding transcriptional ArsR family regulator